MENYGVEGRGVERKRGEEPSRRYVVLSNWF
jgi:hypothetical protein